MSCPAQLAKVAEDIEGCEYYVRATTVGQGPSLWQAEWGATGPRGIGSVTWHSVGAPKSTEAAALEFAESKAVYIAAKM